MHLLQSQLDAGAQTLGALGLLLVRCIDLRGIEARSLERLGERRRAATLVDVRLGALGLQAIENGRELTHLLIVQIELVGQEAQRAPHAKTASVIVEAVMASVTLTTTGMKVCPAPPPPVMVPWTAPIAAMMTGPRVGVLVTSSRVVLLVLTAQPTPKTWMHLFFFLLPGLFAPGGA